MRYGAIILLLVLSAVALAQKPPVAVPGPLTQLSIHKDRVDENLKGIVKSVIVESQNALAPAPKRVRRLEKNYDQTGNVTSERLYDRWGKVNNETTYVNDYATGKRTAKVRALYEGAKSDDDTTVEYSYKHDAEGRTTEIVVISSKEKCPLVTTYQRDKNIVKSYETPDAVPCKSAKAFQIGEDSLNKNGDEIKSMFFIPFGAVVEYTYEAFDAKGNWIKRRVLENKGDPNPLTIEYRTIIYYE